MKSVARQKKNIRYIGKQQKVLPLIPKVSQNHKERINFVSFILKHLLNILHVGQAIMDREPRSTAVPYTIQALLTYIVKKIILNTKTHLTPKKINKYI